MTAIVTPVHFKSKAHLQSELNAGAQIEKTATGWKVK